MWKRCLMEKLILCCAVLLILGPGAAMAQEDHPRLELFGGYQLVRPEKGNDILHGWDAQFSGNFNRWFGLKADISGVYGIEDFDYQVEPGKVNTDSTFQQYLFGPQFSARRRRFTPFAHWLLGFSRADITVATEPPAALVKNHVAETNFGMALGGGVDIDVSKTVALRVAQTDWLMSRFNDNTQNHFRYSGGVVIKWH